jgi:competence ComEA-like helix-hairpin-helix protein
VIRLYYVDAPETNEEDPERLEDQATFFGLSRSQTMELGHEASQFTAHELSGNFTVVTRWENGGGKGNLSRFYGIVMVNGKNLSAELIRHGLARIHGKTVKWPDGPRSTQFMSELRNLELEAREQRSGAWDNKRFPRSPERAGPTPSQPTQVDLNEASVGELEALPGIGRKMAERIIAQRPFRSVADLRTVPGVGSKKFEKLRPLVTVKSPPRAR